MSSTYKYFPASAYYCKTQILTKTYVKCDIDYILSSKSLVSILSYDYDFSIEEIVNFYISMLRSIVIRLNETTIRFFFNEASPNFSLYSQAIKFYNYNDRMIINAVRTITLSCYKRNPVTSVECDTCE